MSFTRDLLLGLRSHAIAQGVTTAIVVGGDLPSTPDVAVALNLYDSEDFVEVARSDVRVQFMCRGSVNDTMSAADLADQLFDIFHALEGLWIGDLHVALCSRLSVVPLGIDSSKRTTRADNYELLVDVPSTARRPI